MIIRSKNHKLELDEYCVCIVGAGPSGLWGLAQAKLLGLKAILVESLDAVGGQCYYLYPEKKLYDIPGAPDLTGKTLVTNLLKQAGESEILLNQPVLNVYKSDKDQSNLYTVQTLDYSIRAKSVILSTGYGDFTYRKLNINPDLEDELEDKKIMYKIVNKKIFKEKDIIVLGGGDSALDWCNDLLGIASKITLVHRRDKFRGLQSTLDQIKKSGVEVLTPYEVKSIGYKEACENLSDNLQVTMKKKVLDRNCKTKSKVDTDIKNLECDYLLCFLGIQQSFKKWDLDYIDNKIKINPNTYETSKEMIFAVGSASHIEGKKRLILTGFDEITQILYLVHKRLNPDVEIGYFSESK